jgi:hypothetical protein
LGVVTGVVDGVEEAEEAEEEGVSLESLFIVGATAGEVGGESW